MKSTFATLIFLLILGVAPLFAQNNYAVKGTVIDDFSTTKLVNTTIMVLNAKDSTLRKFTRAGTDGAFTIDHLSKGKFILVVSYPDYADYVEQFSLDSVNTTHNFNSIGLKLKSRILQDVIIKGKATAIKIKGDTTEYNAAAFSIQPNSKVEDLLRQLPGMQVDKDGKITAQGQTVSKVLVDGEEFFGDDPTLVTKNVRADMVDKVQLYDKKSDQATFTGIDDGQKTKTINIKLKEDKKNGYFGKVDGGVATDKYYSGQLLFNQFQGKRKFSAYGTLSNTGKTGLGWQDSQKYGSSDNVTVGDDGGIYITGGQDDLDSFDGRYNGQGIPTARTGGLHFDDKWNNDKQSLNANYKIGSIAVDGTTNVLSQNNLDSGAINSTSNQHFHNYMFRQKLDFTLGLKLDTTSNLKIMADVTTKPSETKNDYISANRRAADSTLINTNNRSLDNKVDGTIFNASAFYTKKFKKVGRTLSLNVTEAYNQSEAKGFLKSHIDFYNKTGTSTDSSQIVDQYKTSNLKSSVFNTNLTYSEPFSKAFSVVLNYGLSTNNSTADRKSFNPTSDGQYIILDNAYSNNYRLNQLSNQGGAIFNYKSGKTTFNFGTKVGDVKFKQINEISGGIFQRNFINWNPQAMYQYRFSQQSSFRINYFGNTTQPTVSQIQPILDNSNTLNLIVGNQNLTPSFTHRFNISYNTYKVLSDQSLFFYGNYSITTNPIISNVSTDPVLGKSVSQYVNIKRAPYTFYGGAYFSQKVAGPDINLGVDANAEGSKSYSISNGIVDTITLNTYSISARLSKYVQKKYDFYLSFGPTYTIGGASLQKGINNNGHGWNGDAGGEVFLPGKIQVGVNANYQYNSKTQTFDQSFSRVLLNASISKAFFKAENLKLVLSGNDLLNQNAGFNRSVNGNLISQSTYTTIRRYFMFSVVWDFNKMGGAPAKK